MIWWQIKIKWRMINTLQVNITWECLIRQHFYMLFCVEILFSWNNTQVWLQKVHNFKIHCCNNLSQHNIQYMYYATHNLLWILPILPNIKQTSHFSFYFASSQTNKSNKHPLKCIPSSLISSHPSPQNPPFAFKICLL